MRPWRRSYLGVLCLVALLVVAGCAGGRQSSRKRAEEVTLVLSGGSHNSLNPYNANEANRQVGGLIFRGLTRPLAFGQPEPDLLSELPTVGNGGISRDGRSVTLRLRTDARWQDGRHITADDVAFTLAMLRDGTLIDDPKLGYDQIQSVTVEDSGTVHLRLSAPNSLLVWGMVPYVLPKHLLANEPVVVSAHYWQRPVGSGLYRVLESTPGEAALLEPSDGRGVRLRVVFAQTNAEAERAYKNADSVVWAGAPETQTVPGESVAVTSSGTWRGWFFKRRAGSDWVDAQDRAQLLSLIPSEDASAIPDVDPFGLPHSPRSVSTTETVAKHFAGKGWRLTGGRLLLDHAKATLTLLFPTPNEANVEWFMGIQKAFTSIGLTPTIRKADPPNVGGYFDEDYLTRTTREDDFDFGYTRVSFGWPTGSGWPFLASDAPSWENPYGGNVFKVNEPTLDAAYRRVLAAGDPASALVAWQETGRELKALGIVSWEYPELNRIRSKGVDGVQAGAYPVTALESAPRWRTR